MAAPAPKILVLHGPNLNLLGKRPRGVYGNEDLPSIDSRLRELAAGLGVEIDIVQSNHEGTLLDLLAEADGKYQGSSSTPEPSRTPAWRSTTSWRRSPCR